SQPRRTHPRVDGQSLARAWRGAPQPALVHLLPDGARPHAGELRGPGAGDEHPDRSDLRREAAGRRRHGSQTGRLRPDADWDHGTGSGVEQQGNSSPGAPGGSRALPRVHLMFTVIVFVVAKPSTVSTTPTLPRPTSVRGIFALT